MAASVGGKPAAPTIAEADPAKGQHGRWKLYPEARDLDGDVAVEGDEAGAHGLELGRRETGEQPAHDLGSQLAHAIEGHNRPPGQVVGVLQHHQRGRRAIAGRRLDGTLELVRREHAAGELEALNAERNANDRQAQHDPAEQVTEEDHESAEDEEQAEDEHVAEHEPALSRQRRKELGGRDGPEPVRYGDWERKGIAVDF